MNDETLVELVADAITEDTLEYWRFTKVRVMSSVPDGPARQLVVQAIDAAVDRHRP